MQIHTRAHLYAHTYVHMAVHIRRIYAPAFGKPQSDCLGLHSVKKNNKKRNGTKNSAKMLRGALKISIKRRLKLFQIFFVLISIFHNKFLKAKQWNSNLETELNCFLKYISLVLLILWWQRRPETCGQYKYFKIISRTDFEQLMTYLSSYLSKDPKTVDFR